MVYRKHLKRLTGWFCGDLLDLLVLEDEMGRILCVLEKDIGSIVKCNRVRRRIKEASRIIVGQGFPMIGFLFRAKRRTATCRFYDLLSEMRLLVKAAKEELSESRHFTFKNI